MTFLFIRKATEAEIKKDPSRFSELKIVIFSFMMDSTLLYKSKFEVGEIK